MDFDICAGTSLIITAYLFFIFLFIKSMKIVKKIKLEHLYSLRKIKKELNNK